MCKLVLLIIPVLQRNEYAQVVCASNDADIGACELGTELIEASSGDAFLRTVDIESGDRRVVRGLFGKIGEFYALVDDAAGAA